MKKQVQSSQSNPGLVAAYTNEMERNPHTENTHKHVLIWLNKSSHYFQCSVMYEYFFPHNLKHKQCSFTDNCVMTLKMCQKLQGRQWRKKVGHFFCCLFFSKTQVKAINGWRKNILCINFRWMRGRTWEKKRN